jgi:hypothetical protein
VTIVNIALPSAQADLGFSDDDRQAGGSIGIALLSTVEGYTTAFWWGAAIFAAGALTTGGLLRSAELRDQPPEPVHHGDAGVRLLLDPLH